MPNTQELVPSSYGATLKAIKQRVQRERLHAVLAANSAMVLLYWDIGRLILERQTQEGWGAKVIDRLARDLQKSFPALQGFSSRNLLFMRRFAEEFPDAAIVKQVASQLPWWHLVRLIQSVKAPKAREWYMREAIRQGWSRSVLEMQLLGNAYERQGKAVTNFASVLPHAESRTAAEVFKDPYLFDFLGNADLNRERQIEQALVDHIQRFMLELGSGFAFVGRQVHLPVGDEDFFLDLLFYHLKLRCYVVIELKAVPFDPASPCIRLQVRCEPNRARAIIARSFDDLTNRLHDVADDRILHIYSVGKFLDQRHYLRTNYRRATQTHEGPHDFYVHAYGGVASKYAREHGDALLGEGPVPMTSSAVLTAQT
jgi:predicted nuclease of restriction endonuclease-like (RecB) superfamily